MGRLVQRVFQRLFDMSEKVLPKETGAVLEVKRSLPGTEELLSMLTPDEKINLISGYRSFAVSPVPRLGIPPVWMSDATGGLRLFGGGTAFPCPLAMAATWNPALVRRAAAAIGGECRRRGVSILLGPGVNICRVPTGGRNFEYFGEDPFLAGALAAAYITGTRSAGVESVVKHFACNNSDYDRHRENAVVDERTLREIYLPAFRTAVRDAGVRYVMSAYNQINGVYASENRRLLTEILRDEWGFTGAVMSDWISTYSTAAAALAGLDLEMPGPKRFSPKKIHRALRRGELNWSDIDGMVRHILSARGDGGTAEPPPAVETALQTAAEGIVLLKNEGVLPLERPSVRRIVVTGSRAVQTPTGGGGSSYVRPRNSRNILDGIREAAGPGTEVIHLPRKGRLKKADYDLVRSADAVIVAVGFDRTWESECYDRQWHIPEGGGRLIREVSGLNKAAVAVLFGGGAMEAASWIGAPAGVLHAFYLGESTAAALAGVIFGDINPSGRLPVTLPRNLEDVEAVRYYRRKPWKTNFPRIFGPQGVRGLRRVRDIHYGEGLAVGYRGYGAEGPRPLFPFGFGLSYTSFEYSQPSIKAEGGNAAVEVSVTLKNTGSRAGAEVVQVYLRDPESRLDRPFAELKGFAKVHLPPGQEERVTLPLKEEVFACYDDIAGAWVVEEGEFIIMICRNAEEVVFQESVHLPGRVLNRG